MTPPVEYLPLRVTPRLESLGWGLVFVRGPRDGRDDDHSERGVAKEESAKHLLEGGFDLEERCHRGGATEHHGAQEEGCTSEGTNHHQGSYRFILPESFMPRHCLITAPSS